MSKFKLAAFVADTVSSTKNNWTAISGEEAYIAEYSRLFESVEAHVGNENNNHESIYYGLFENEEDFASSIVEVVTSPKAKGTMTKILNIDMSPKFIEAHNFHHEIIEIHVNVITKSLTLSKSVQKGYQLKLYGRTNEFLSVLHSIHAVLAKNKPKSIKKVDMQGRWLVIEHV